MASRFRSFSKPTFSIVKSTINKPTLKPKPASSLLPAPSSPTFSRVCFAVQTQEFDSLQMFVILFPTRSQCASIT
ncbi:hypothetical protein V6N12_072164 [Hibiscus sabdariffa]|uniref:Uncharacterized protein n=1 Tax=Hibiscus sabdariffa TaxID=183260 RepID=A0ABR2FMP8_9ROSI